MSNNPVQGLPPATGSFSEIASHRFTSSTHSFSLTFDLIYFYYYFSFADAGKRERNLFQNKSTLSSVLRMLSFKLQSKRCRLVHRRDGGGDSREMGVRLDPEMKRGTFS